MNPGRAPSGSLERFGAAGAFPLVMPFLWEFPPPVSNEEINNAAKLPYSAASALCPFTAFSIAIRVARVSRLIGKSDTTAKRTGWQVYFVVTQSPEVSTQPKTAQTQETPLPWEWRFAVLRWSLASQMNEGGGCILRACCRLSGRFPLLRAASLAVALAGSCCSWAGRNFPQQPVHHWHFLDSNPWAVQIPSCFQSLVQNRTRKVSGFWNSECKRNPKNNRRLSYFWH